MKVAQDPEALQARLLELENENQQLRLYRELLENSPFSMQVFEGDGTSRYMTPGLQQLMGIPKREDSYGVFNILQDKGSQKNGLVSYFLKAHAGATVHIPEIPLDLGQYQESWGTHDQTTWVEAQLVPLRDDSGDVSQVACYLRDTTEHRQAVQALVEKRYGDGLSGIANGVALGFSNVLTGILGNASFAREYLSEAGSELSKCIDEIIASTKQAEELAQQLLLYATHTHGYVGPVCLSDLVKEAAKVLRPSLASKARLQVYTKTEEKILGNISYLRHTLSELIGFVAAQTEEEFFTLEIDVTREGEESRVSPRLKGRWVERPENLLRVRLSSHSEELSEGPLLPWDKKGSLGLVIAKSVLRSHGGQLLVDRSEAGTVEINLYFPVTRKLANHPQAPVSAHEQHNPTSVLIVEREPSMGSLMRRALRRLGYETIIVPEKELSVDRLQELELKIDIAVVDVHTLEYGPKQPFERLQQRNPKLKLLIISAKSSSEYSNLAIVSDEYQFVKKPFTIQQLDEAILKLHLETPVTERAPSPAQQNTIAVESIQQEETVRADSAYNVLVLSSPAAQVDRLKVLEFLRDGFGPNSAQLYLDVAPDSLPLPTMLKRGGPPQQIIVWKEDFTRLAAIIHSNEPAENRLSRLFREFNELMRGARVRLLRGGASVDQTITRPIIIPIEELKREAYTQALKITNGNVKLAAERLGVSLSSLYRQLKEYELSLEDYRSE